MPCWYFEKKDIKNSPSFYDGVDTLTENRYRREGARFIIDAGAKLGLRYDTCATGVTYFHRFYMYHSFKEFHRYVTASCCLFLSGKVEETPKKCKDIIKICQSLLSPSLFAVFGDDPREEIMTMERILLQTIKFDLQIEHPYSKVLKYAKFVLGDKEKIQKMVQMAWTFINDSMCTTLSLQWEPDIIATSLMYLASRLTKFEITDWQGKNPGSKTKWWDAIVEDISMDLMEDICHQVLDLYSPENRKKDESPSLSPPSTSKPPPAPPSGGATPSKVRRPSSPPEGLPANKQPRLDTKGGNQNKPSAIQAQSAAPVVSQALSSTGYTSYNPYVATGMYASSFMSQEGTQKIQALFGQSAPTSQPGYQTYQAQQAVQAPGVPTYSTAVTYTQASYTAGYQAPAGYTSAPPGQAYNPNYPPNYPQPTTYQPGNQYVQPPPVYPSQYQYPQYPVTQSSYSTTVQHPNYAGQGYTAPASTIAVPYSQDPPTTATTTDTNQSGLPTVRITPRR